MMSKVENSKIAHIAGAGGSVDLVADAKKKAVVCNINVGILGHVDSGKTSLVKALSTSLSTASLDKNPQSQQRGITLDLGFSSFTLPMPKHIRSMDGGDDSAEEYDAIQFTLVDCPGHASLIKTIIGGAQIIDMIVLVIDANKGIQTQTAECIVIGEITTKNLIIVLNKIDVIPIEEREKKLEKVMNRIRNTFKTTKFKDAPIVCTAAATGGEKVAALGGKAGLLSMATLDIDLPEEKSIGIDSLVEVMLNTVKLPSRDIHAPFYFAIDHCFPIKGHGTVLTGTVLSGSVSTNQIIEMPYIQQERKVKSMQMFHKSVKTAKQGDRVGICITNLDSSTIERGIAAAPRSVPLIQSVLCLVKKVRFFRGACKSNSKYHVSIGHTTIIATATFFGANEFNVGHTMDVDSGGKRAVSTHNTLNASHCEGFPSVRYDWSKEFETQDTLAGENAALDDNNSTSSLIYGSEALQWACLRFQQPVYCPMGSLIIGSRLDTDTREDSSGAKMCRLAFYGPIIEIVREDEVCSTSFDKVRIYTQKQKKAEILKLTDVRTGGLCYELIAHKLFSDGGSLTPFIGMKVKTRRGQIGTITASFGSGGQFKVKFIQGVPRSNIHVGSYVYLAFKRFSGDKEKAMIQSGHDLDPQILPAMDTDSEIHAIQETTKLAAASQPKLQSSGDSVKKQSADAVDKAKSSPKIKVKATVTRRGTVDILKEPIATDSSDILYTICIVSGAFQMEENIKEHIGSVVTGPQGELGELVGPFAKMGKCKVKFSDGIAGPEGIQVNVTILKK